MPELVPIPSPGEPVYFGEPGNPVVVLVHDWYGRTPGLLPIADALAVKAGFRVVVPDFYDGVCTVDAGDAEVLMQALDVRRSLAIIDDVIREARDEGSTRVGIVGFSLGGWLTLMHAQGGAADAVVAYYATLSEKEDGVIPAPVLLHFAEDDEFEPTADAESFVERLTDHGTPVTTHTYLGTEHSFANGSIPSLFDRNAAALAFARTAAFLEDHLSD